MTMTPAIAIVGAACRYPDANTLSELWENVLAGRRAFRRIPPERLALADYGSADRSAVDYTYATQAALLEGYEFDRIRFRVSSATYRSVDVAHWVALDVAAEALRDAGFPDALVLPRATTAVLVGNTMTGEFSRASALRLRWPYVKRVVDAVLAETGEPRERRATLLPRIEAAFKAPFPEPDGETLAGALSNTIAGRICNYFDLQGGGYTLDGACASSLLAVAQACSSLTAGDIDAAIVGGVDLSLDPFELVGFARAGALASDDMRVFDALPTGFWPGEGCGFVLLMREEDAISAGRRIYALIRGWGVSSDGSGGLTRPELGGQLLALERAYARAGFDPGSVTYYEGHGTGTAVGDTTELAALSKIRRKANPMLPPAVIGSIKANIGHTKAAAGIAGLLKAMLAVQYAIVPPTCGTREPHAALAAPEAALRLQERPAPWPSAMRRAGVSAMGFGGINVHVVIEGRERQPFSRHTLEACSRSWQDAELFLVSADTHSELQNSIERLAALAPVLSSSELVDLAVHLQGRAGSGSHRAAVVASTAAELAGKLSQVKEALSNESTRSDIPDGVFVAHVTRAPRLAFLFSGQAAPVRTRGGIWSRRFATVDELYQSVSLPDSANPLDTSVSQPAIVTASLAAVRCLEDLGLHGDIAIGHSLGELSALRWSGTLPTDASAIALASTRGRLMADLAEGPGAMVALATNRDVAERLVSGTGAWIAGFNAPQQITVSGLQSAITHVIERAQASGVAAARLPVACAFHSPLMQPVVTPYREVLATTPLRAVTAQKLISTVTGRALLPDIDLCRLLEQQLCSPVLFAQAIEEAGPVDLFIELGPGHTLATLAALCTNAPAVSVDAAGSSLRPLLVALGAAFALGAPMRVQGLAAERFSRSFRVDRVRAFLSNPCELAPTPSDPVRDIVRLPHATEPSIAAGPGETEALEDTCTLLRALVSHYTDLPLESIEPHARFLSDLHLNSITVADILARAARRIGAPPFTAPTDFADASLADTATVLDQAREMGATPPTESIAGVEPWVRTFTIDEEEQPLNMPTGPVPEGPWEIIAPPHHPLRSKLGELLRDGRNGPGTIVCIERPSASCLHELLNSAKAALRNGREGRFMIVQPNAIAGGFARSLFLESSDLDVGVITADFADPATPSRICSEIRSLSGFVDVRYDEKGRRLVSLARVGNVDGSGNPILSSEDVLLVTGGGKGIVAECALAIAKECGVKLALVGRADPATDVLLASNLDRMRAAGVTIHYERADIGNPDAVRNAVSGFRASVGHITAVLHGAGVNAPCLIAALDELAIEATMRPKVDGARHVLDACDPSRLRLFVAFGSIIARTGLRGEAHYALANEQLREFTLDVARRLTNCRVLALEWSVWSGVGMAERLGRVEPLVRQGVLPIAVDDGVSLFTSLLRANGPTGALVVSSRFGDLPTLRVAGAPLPYLRFLESPRVYYPGIELVADATLSLESDPYLADHCFEGHLLFPAVLGIEAIVQAAMALHGGPDLPELSDVQFARPLVVPTDGTLVLRTAAYQEPGGRVRVHLRSNSTGFAVDHFHAQCSWPSTLAPADKESGLDDAHAVAVDAETTAALYGVLLFQSGRFARVRRYVRLFATECIAEIDTTRASWFGPYLPPELLLGDAGTRDAILHCVQASVPHRRVVPIAVDRISIRRQPAGPCRVYARQRSESGDSFTWDLQVLDRTGEVAETWIGLQLRSVARLPLTQFPVPLLGPYIERQLTALGHVHAARVLVSEAMGPSTSGSGKATASRITPVSYSRPDGRPEANNGDQVSAAHVGRLTIAVTNRSAVGCDVEQVTDRPEHVWRDLLGTDRAHLADVLTRDSSDSYSVGATRVWAAIESLKKAGAPMTSHIVLDGIREDGWVTMRAGRYAISTWIAKAFDDRTLALAVATGDAYARF